MKARRIACCAVPIALLLFGFTGCRLSSAGQARPLSPQPNTVISQPFATEQSSGTMPPPQTPETGAILGAMFDPDETTAYCEDMPKYGIKALTITISWTAIEPGKGQFSWDKYDKIVDDLRACGLTIGAHVLSESKWATLPVPSIRNPRRGGASMPPKDMQDYYDFMFNLAGHFNGKISRYSIENEAAAPRNWGSTPEAYADLLGTAYNAIHAADPQAIVLPDGISSVGLTILYAIDLLDAGKGQEAVNVLNSALADYPPEGYEGGKLASVEQLQALLNHAPEGSWRQWLPMLLANRESFDAFEMHFYQRAEYLPVLLDWLHQKLKSAGGDKPVEIWELGYGWRTTAPLDLNAQAIATTQLLATAVGEGVPFAELWRWTNRYEGAGTGLTGVIGPTGPRPAATAFAVAARKLGGVTHAERLNLAPGVSAYRYLRSDKESYALWSDQPTEVRLPTDWDKVTVTDIQGQVSERDAKNLKVSDSPVFVESP